MIKAVLIDIDNTLLDFNDCAKWSMQQACEELGLVYKDDMFATFLQVNDFLWGQIEKGIITRDDLLKVRYATIFDKLNIDFDGIKFENMFRNYLEKSGHTVKDAHKVMDYLTSKYPVYAASNGFEQHQIGRLKESKMLDKFDGIFVSERAGYDKPSGGFFDYCLARMPKLAKNEIIMIGDSVYADMKGAIDYGLKTCWFDYKKTNNQLKNVDFIVTELAEILAIL